MALREWRLGRVLVLSGLWIVVVEIVLVARSIAWARQLQPQPSDDVYVVLVHLPGGFWTLFGPPVLLISAWLGVRRS